MEKYEKPSLEKVDALNEPLGTWGTTCCCNLLV